MKRITSHKIVKNGHNIVLTIASILLIITLFYAAFFVSNTNNAKAGADDALSGWAWSDNIGWISFNCLDTSSCGIVDYGVDMAVNGDLSGYAWSDNIGWVTFNEGDLSGCPQGACKAKLAGNNLQGWARALSYGDGWDGWISLNGSNYGITFNDPDFEGFAWDASDVSGQSIGSGWIQFNPVFGGVTTDPSGGGSSVTVNLSANPTPVSPGGNSTLIWTSSNAVSCTASAGWSGSKALSGSEVVGPHAIDTVYRLTCQNATSQGSNDATVFVSAPAQCSDDADNDEDTLKDIFDPGCYTNGTYDPNDDDETNTLPQCSNNFDDDGDGQADFPDDTDCDDADDDNEFAPICGDDICEGGENAINCPADCGSIRFDEF